MIGVHIVAAALADSLYFYTRVLVGPDVVVTVLRTLLDTRNLDLLRGTKPSRGTVDNLARESLLHTFLFTLFNLQKPL